MSLDTLNSYRLLLGCCVLLITVLIREIVKYEPDEYKYRFYHSMQQKGWFAQKASLSKIGLDDTFVILTLGQSNAGNYGNVKYNPRFTNQVFNYSNGNLYVAKDPLIGCGGHNGSVWGRLADLLIENKLCQKVIIIPIAVGGSTVDDWATSYCHQKLTETLNDLKAHQIDVTHILWHQGEADNGKTPKDRYEQGLEAILKTIRNNGFPAPFYTSIASYTPTSIHDNGTDPAIRNAQKDFILKHPHVYAGPDTDTLITAMHRYDAQHFSEAGLRAFAKQWLEAIQNPQEH